MIQKVDASQISKDLNKKMISDENIVSKEGEWCISKNIYDAARNADALNYFDRMVRI